IGYLSIDDKQRERDVKKDQHQQTVKRYQLLNQALKENYSIDKSKATDFDSRLDKILTHKFFGYAIFLALLLVMFQAIFTWSGPLMDGIESGFAWLSEKTSAILGEGKLSELISQGIIPGIGGVVIFVPQIAILF